MSLTVAQQRILDLMGEQTPEPTPPPLIEQVAQLTQRVDAIDGVLEDLAPEVSADSAES